MSYVGFIFNDELNKRSERRKLAEEIRVIIFQAPQDTIKGKDLNVAQLLHFTSRLKSLDDKVSKSFWALVNIWLFEEGIRKGLRCYDAKGNQYTDIMKYRYDSMRTRDHHIEIMNKAIEKWRN